MALFDLLTMVNLVLADAAVLLDPLSAEFLNVWLKFDIPLVKPDRSTDGEVATNMAAVARLADHLEAELVVLAEDAIDSMTVLGVHLAGTAPAADDDPRRACSRQLIIDKRSRCCGGGLVLSPDGGEGGAGSSSLEIACLRAGRVGQYSSGPKEGTSAERGTVSAGGGMDIAGAAEAAMSGSVMAMSPMFKAVLSQHCG
ncbi:hypothetical protein NLG97_g1195 [Lecanicillium saksenae]|uniref:Uncharacterized protein n=1 Tax=Lecanicillium saksenae TaxID=468837 RepID=A0ACC1R8J5_9HYPO|nr:hypothetical protein NLG97_g1195 [Lecanicillium saksenae]